MRYSVKIAIVCSAIGVALTCLPRPAGAQCSTSTGYGTGALQNATGCYNSAFGYNTLYTLTTGTKTTGVGYDALYNNTASESTAVGYYALRANTTGELNTAVGSDALSANTTGRYNTPLGQLP